MKLSVPGSDRTMRAVGGDPFAVMDLLEAHPLVVRYGDDGVQVVVAPDASRRLASTVERVQGLDHAGRLARVRAATLDAEEARVWAEVERDALSGLLTGAPSPGAAAGLLLLAVRLELRAPG